MASPPFPILYHAICDYAISRRRLSTKCDSRKKTGIAFFYAIIFTGDTAGKEDFMPQYAIMRFAKQKGGAGALEAHHERTKEKYASNPDVDTARSRHNIHIIKPEKSYLQESNSRIEAAGCRTRKNSVRFIDTLITASPAFFKGKNNAEVKAFFETAVEFLSRKIGKQNIFTAVVHMDEKTPQREFTEWKAKQNEKREGERT
jgi:hypothetical protein